MTPFTIIFLAINAAALIGLPRNLAPLPLLVGCCYMTVGQSFDIGPISCTVIRVLIATGIARIMMKGERIAGELNGMDKLMIAWMAWIVLSSPLFPGAKMPLVFNLGQAFNIGGMYFLFRVFCSSVEDLVGTIRMTAWLLAPIAVEMAMEHLTGRNMFSVFGGYVAIRDEKFRAVGPFSHAILAGSVGAACLPLMVGIWSKHRSESIAGMIGCIVIVIASNSSGPIMSLAFGVLALLLWRYRHLSRYFGRAMLLAYLALEMVMNRPAYYIIGEIDLTGSSTGWHRAALIEAAIDHLGEWWLAGTDFTRHWMPTGVSWSPNHTDITNYYILMGTWAGLPLVALFIAMIVTGFRYLGRMIRQHESPPFVAWCLGAALFAHAGTCISVAYFDQSYIFMFLCLAVVSSLHAVGLLEIEVEEAYAFADELPGETSSSPVPMSSPRFQMPGLEKSR